MYLKSSEGVCGHLHVVGYGLIGGSLGLALKKYTDKAYELTVDGFLPDRAFLSELNESVLKLEGEINAVKQAEKERSYSEEMLKECYSDIDDPSDVVMDYEILVGTTNRPESRVAMSGLRDADCTMQVIGNKLVLGGPGTKGTEKAVMQFLTSFVYEQGDRYGVAAGKPQNLVFSSKDIRLLLR